MTDSSRYPVPATRCRAELVVDRSRFICSLARASTPEDAQAFVRDIQAEFAGATHHCWAYVAGAPSSTIRIGMSDDGEPHGTAGRPMLTVLLHSGVGEIAAVVTRYYGGTKLGTGGLARAYSGAVQAALGALVTHERVEFLLLTVRLGYPYISAVRHLLPSFEATLSSERFAEDVTFDLQAPTEHLPALRAAIANATQGSAIFPDDGPDAS
jgi:uncharacterized YigZ family protein